MNSTHISLEVVDLVSRECAVGNDFNGQLGLRIGSIFIILAASFLGVMVPLISSQVKQLHMPDYVYFIAKYFGSGVICSTAFIHLLLEAHENLSNKCLPQAFHDYPYAFGIALVSIFITLFIELVTRYKIGGKGHSHGPSALTSTSFLDNPSVKESHPCTPSEIEMAGTNVEKSQIQIREEIEEVEKKINIAGKIGNICLLEAGIVLHSVFVGLSLAVTNQFITLFVVIIFHQMFEGLGLGARLAATPWPESKRWVPWVFAIAFSITTPIGVGIGLAARESYQAGSAKALITNGIFDASSAGILIYTALVELMGNEFMFSDEFHDASFKTILYAYLCMCAGAGGMSLLGRWA